MVQAIRPIGGDIQFEDRVVAVRFHAFDGEANAGQLLAQLAGIDRDIHELS